MDCPVCVGEGQIINNIDRESGDVLDAIPCPHCNGTGELNGLLDE